MRLQLSASVTRPMTRQQPVPLNPTNANNATPALNQRQGFTQDQLKILRIKKDKLVNEIASARTPSAKFKFLEDLQKLFRRADYFIECLTDQVWLESNNYQRRETLRNPKRLFYLGPSSGLASAIDALTPENFENQTKIEALVNEFKEFSGDLSLYFMEQFQDDKLQKYIKKSIRRGSGYPWYRTYIINSNVRR
ncbi:MAG: hypothetical protein ACK551_06700 [Vampirovibrionales bacterium]